MLFLHALPRSSLALILVTLCSPGAAQAPSQPHAHGDGAAPCIDVTIADGEYVLKPLVRSSRYDQAVALENTRRIHAIITAPQVGPQATFFFPAGHYYFEGVVGDWVATIETTHPQQTIAGQGMNATHLHQAGSEPAATIRINHSRGAVANLSIASADHEARFRADWDAQPHQAAIHLAAPDSPWSLDPQIRNVAVNSTGNNITMTDYFRPFTTGVRITGPWLNVYVHTMVMRDVWNAINVNQGGTMGGPAKFIDVNVYATVPPPPGQPADDEDALRGSTTWNTFFKSESHFMEQVELIHCTYIGSQFIYMDGSNASSPETTPVYNMLIDHCYINTLWLPAGNEAKWSGIYMKLPPKPGGIVPGFGSQLYSRTITFTNNTAAGKSPRDGAFFYVEGNLKQLVFSENLVSSGGSECCLYVRPTSALLGEDVGIRQIEISHNIFNDFRNPITIGDKRWDPGRQAGQFPRGIVPQDGSPDAAGQQEQPWVETVLILDNQVCNLPVIEKGLLTTAFLHRARQVTISGNVLAKTDRSALVLRDCRDVVMRGNQIPGFQGEAQEGVHLMHCTNAVLQGNLLQDFATGIRLSRSRNVSLVGNQVLGCGTGIRCEGVANSTLTGNLIDDGQTDLVFEGSHNVTAAGNLLPSAKVTIGDGNERLLLQREWEQPGD